MKEYAMKPFSIQDITIFCSQITEFEDIVQLKKVLSIQNDEGDRHALDILICRSQGNIYIVQLLCSLIKSFGSQILSKISIDSVPSLKSMKSQSALKSTTVLQMDDNHSALESQHTLNQKSIFNQSRRGTYQKMQRKLRNTNMS